MAYKYDKRTEKLAKQYVIALRLTNQIIDSGILERKIKVTTKNFEEIRRPLLAAMAADLRYAEKNSDTLSLDIHDRLCVTEAYFDELAARGDEWEYADLRQDFLTWQRSIQKQLEND